MSGVHKLRENASSDDGNTADWEDVRFGRSPYVTPAEDAGVDILGSYAWRFSRGPRRGSRGAQYWCISSGVVKGKMSLSAHGRARFLCLTCDFNNSIDIVVEARRCMPATGD